MPQATVALLGEAATLEPAVALRRFVENALAPSTVERRAGDRRPDPRAPARDARRIRPHGRRRPPPGRRSTRTTGSASLTAPTLVQHGERGRRRRSQERRAARASSSRTRASSPSPGRGHLFFWEEPERFVAIGQRVPRGERLMAGDLTIGRWLSDRARTTPDRVAIRFLDGELTYEALERRATRLAAGLAARGLRRGDRLATLDGHVARPRRDVLRLRAARRRAAADLVAARAGRDRLPARRRGAVAAARRPPSTRSSRALPARAVEIAQIADPTLEADARGRGRRERRRPAAPRLHVRDDREAEGRSAHARELLLDEPLLRPDGRPSRRRRRPAGAAAVPRRRLERAAAARVVEGGDGRARAGVRRRARPAR